MSRRVVITGSGFVLPLGNSTAQARAALGEASPFRRADADQDVAICPVSGFDLKSYTGRFKNARYLTRGQQLCLAAAILAGAEAGLGRMDCENGGIFLGLGPNLEARPRTDKALWLLDCLPNTLASAMAEILGFRGENLTIMTACAASTQALGQAYRTIAGGLADVALAGGGDSRISPQGIQAYRQAGVLATNFARPNQACRPFDRDRSGFAVGEGGAMFVLEALEHAQARGATILAEIVGASSSLDGTSLTGQDPAGRAAMRAVHACLDSLSRDNLCILAHGTGTVMNDAVEAEILARTAPEALAIAAFKSRMGHLASACGAAELALGLMCAASGYFPAISNLEHPIRADLPLLRTDMILKPAAILLQSFGFGGQNSCLGVRPWP